MSIERLEISGYRSLEHVVWEPGPLNVLIGPNGSGKSNLLRALQLLKAAAEGKLAETVRREGGMVPLLWDGQAGSLRFSIHSTPLPAGLAYSLTADQIGHSSSFMIEHEALVSAASPGHKYLDRSSTRASVHTSNGIETEIHPEELDGTEALLAKISFPDDKTAAISSMRRTLAGYRIYHSLRVDPASELRRATVARLERRVDPDGSNLIAVLHTLYSNEISFREDVNAAMRAAFGEDFVELLFPPAEDGRVQMRLRWRSLKRPQSAADLSDGILRFLFLTAVLAAPDPPPLIAIDEPETGLHPSMLPLVAELAAGASKRTQVILTTHSPQFLDAFSEYPDVTTVAEWRAGRTVLRRLPADKLAKWLEHYQLGELMLSGELETME